MTMKYVCTGHVHPERADVSFSRVEMNLAGGGTAVASSDSSQITVVLNDARSVDGWISACIVATDIAKIVVGALGFSLGTGYSVEILQVTEHDGTPHVFGVRPNRNGQTLRVEPQVAAFNRAIRLSGEDVFFRLALRDYLRAITQVTDCAAYCYRAIEGIKSALVLRTGIDSWDAMHSTLGTERTVITSTVKQYADPIRHGNWKGMKPTTGTDRWRMLCLTRDILIQYMDYTVPAP